MATYRGLPPISVTASTDTTGQNPGKYTCYFSSSILAGLKVPFFEWYHATVTNVPGGASASIKRDGINLWGFTAPGVGGGAEYAPAVGMLLAPGQEIMFFWSTGTGTKPIVTLWFRYDIDDPANAANV